MQWAESKHFVIDLVQEACHFSGPLAFTVYATHRIPIIWATR